MRQEEQKVRVLADQKVPSELAVALYMQQEATTLLVLVVPVLVVQAAKIAALSLSLVVR